MDLQGDCSAQIPTLLSVEGTRLREKPPPASPKSQTRFGGGEHSYSTEVKNQIWGRSHLQLHRNAKSDLGEEPLLSDTKPTAGLREEPPPASPKSKTRFGGGTPTYSREMENQVWGRSPLLSATNPTAGLREEPPPASPKSQTRFGGGGMQPLFRA